MTTMPLRKIPRGLPTQLSALYDEGDLQLLLVTPDLFNRYEASGNITDYAMAESDNIIIGSRCNSRFFTQVYSTKSKSAFGLDNTYITFVEYFGVTAKIIVYHEFMHGFAFDVNTYLVTLESPILQCVSERIDDHKMATTISNMYKEWFNQLADKRADGCKMTIRKHDKFISEDGKRYMVTEITADGIMARMITDNVMKDDPNIGAPALYTKSYKKL